MSKAQSLTPYPVGIGKGNSDQLTIKLTKPNALALPLPENTLRLSKNRKEKSVRLKRNRRMSSTFNDRLTLNEDEME